MISFFEAQTSTYAAPVLTIRTPTRVRKGDTILAVIGLDLNASSVTVPAGWTLEGSLAVGAGTIKLLSRLVGDSEPVSHAFTITTPPVKEPLGAILLYRNIRPSDGAMVHSSNSFWVAGGTNFPTTDRVMGAIPNMLLQVGYSSRAGGVNFTPHATLKERVDFDGAVNGTLFVADRLPKDAGTILSVNSVASAVGDGISVSFAIKSKTPQVVRGIEVETLQLPTDAKPGTIGLTLE